jgi:hypothetical protein
VSLPAVGDALPNLGCAIDTEAPASTIAPSARPANCINV